MCTYMGIQGKIRIYYFSHIYCSHVRILTIASIFLFSCVFQLVYSLNTVRDYGTILCSAENELGLQSEPCVFHLISAGKNRQHGFRFRSIQIKVIYKRAIL